MNWTPHVRADLDLRTLALAPLQGFLLSRLDGRTDLPALASLLALEPDQLSALLEELVAMGAVLPPEPEPEPAPGRPDPGRPDPEPSAGPSGEAPDGAGSAPRQRFETVLRHRTPEDRADLAGTAGEPDLAALCFDPLPRTIAALLDNPHFGPAHARLVALHHRSAAGLESLAARGAFAQDDGVRRALLANPVLPPGVYRRLWSPQRLLAQFLVTTSRECGERTRALAREVLRAAFNQRTGEERVELILQTEGRCLAVLAGITLDGRTTALLCQRTYASTLLIQNIARWSAAPPMLIAHLLRQELVRRNPTLRQALERHPNAG